MKHKDREMRSNNTRVTVCCPSGHRLHGDLRHMGKSVRCPKCEVEVDGSSICRQCGAILEDMPDETGTPANAEHGEAVEDAAPAPTPWRCPGCSETHSETRDTCWNCGTARPAVSDPRLSPGHIERQRQRAAERRQQQSI